MTVYLAHLTPAASPAADAEGYTQASDTSENAADTDGQDLWTEEHASQGGFEDTSEFDYQLPAPGSGRPSDDEHAFTSHGEEPVDEDGLDADADEDWLEGDVDDDEFNDWEA